MAQNGLESTAVQPSQVGLANILGEKGWQAEQPLERYLLVFGAGQLEAPVSAKLIDSGWILLRANSLDEAAALCDTFSVLAGLALFPHPLTNDEFNRISCTVKGLQDLQWLAVLTREALARKEVRRLIIARLRDYQLYPVNASRLTSALGHAWGIAALAEAERHAHDEESEGRFGLVGASPPMSRLYRQIARVSETELPVLITGETGTGKELVARAIHAQSLRSDGPFVALNCAAIPESLLQSELFGAVKGAYTDATADNKGLIRTAEGGTLLLDEIGEMPLTSQASLLRFLEDKIVTPIGGQIGAPANVRIIASTNRDLHEEANAGRFRSDLFYRLNVLTIETPPLRDRAADIQSLAVHFLRAEVNKQVALRPVLGFSADALGWLRAQPWKGNVRQLRSCVIQAALRCQGDRITANDLNRLQRVAQEPSSPLGKIVSDTEKATLERLLANNAGNVSKTARDLHVSRMTVYRLMAKHGIERS